MTDTGWHFSIEDGKSNGPVSLAKLRSAVAIGRIKPTDLVWHETLGDWQCVQSVSLLFNDVPIGATPPPIQQQPTPPFVATDGPKQDSRKVVRSCDSIVNKIIRDRLVSIVAFAFIAAIALVPVAVLASQYFPFTGGFMNGIAAPWSPARRSGIPSHILTLSIVGLFIGGILGELIHRSKTAAFACLIGCIALFCVAFLMCLLIVQQSDYSRGF